MKQTVQLNGCRPEPMAAYLQSLAVLRLISEQVDHTALAWWSGNVFHLKSDLDEEGFVRFFLEHYVPTPIVAPWNGGSGFYEGDQTEGFNTILASTAERFRQYRETIRAIQSFPEMPERELALGDMLDRIQATRNEELCAKVRAELKTAPPAPRDPLTYTIGDFES